MRQGFRRVTQASSRFSISRAATPPPPPPTPPFAHPNRIADCGCFFALVYLFWEAFPALCTHLFPPSSAWPPRASVWFNICCQEFIFFKGKRDSQRVSLRRRRRSEVSPPTRPPSPAVCFLFGKTFSEALPQYYINAATLRLSK